MVKKFQKPLQISSLHLKTTPWQALTQLLCEQPFQLRAFLREEAKLLAAVLNTTFDGNQAGCPELLGDTADLGRGETE
jgi:hypothetical protein